MTKFNERIYALRKANNFTQEEIAQELKVSRQTISNWETGTAQPTIDRVIELANVFDVSMEELIGRSKNKNKKASGILLSLLNQVVTLYLTPVTDVLLSIGRTEIKNCEIIEVNLTSIRIRMEDKNQQVENLIFIKDILGFEKEAD
ncbi:helix-turn-helix domain-containing protein [Carnobacterium sp.]|uniref:helix-turn-helix domain-containing protein n=1 Tax=Carnobacterium sp. TaxID=48221 RepID=UPI002FCC93A2